MTDTKAADRSAAHTPEPWEVTLEPRLSGVFITAADDIAPWPWYIADMNSEVNPDGKGDRIDANAARIVACVNAREGIADPGALGELVEAAHKTLSVLKESGITSLAGPGAARFCSADVALTDALAALGTTDDV